jgi:thymidylate synthase
MALTRFSLIVAVDAGNGIAKDGAIPWNSREDMKFFREKTLGKRKNAVIMGRVTYETISDEHRPLEGRRNVIISRHWKQEENPTISVYPSLVEALAGLGAEGSFSKEDGTAEVFIIGGEQIYREAIRDYLYLCKRIYVTKFKTDYGCNQFFPFDEIKDFPQAEEPSRTRDYVRYVFAPNVSHDEYQYISLLEKIRDQGEQKPDRTGVGTKSIFGTNLEFDIRERIPIITTKKVSYDNIIKELLFFISGKTDTKILEEQGVKIWKGNTSKDFLASRSLPYREGDMGAGYGWQWRHWGAEYKGCDEDYAGKGIDQLKKIVEGIRNDPHSRRHILSAWNVADLDKMALPPCHAMCQFNVSADRKFLDCLLTQRSCDSFLGAPYNIGSYAILTYMICHVCGLRPRKLTCHFGDTHIYNNHNEQVARQIKRTPRPFPRLTFRNSSKLFELDDFTFDSFIVADYTSCPPIQAEMAV